MGQYYMPIIIYPDKSVATLYSHAFGCGSKLTEHSWIGNDLVNAVYSRIHKKPRKVAWIGDYSDDDYEECGEPYTKNLSHKEFIKFYKCAWGKGGKLSEKIPSTRYTLADLSLINHRTSGMYLINHSLRIYIDLGKYIGCCTVKNGTWEGYCMDPLPLLTACGNGRGGGDFSDSDSNIGYEHVGTWAFHELELSDVAPSSYTERDYVFHEG